MRLNKKTVLIVSFVMIFILVVLSGNHSAMHGKSIRIETVKEGELNIKANQQTDTQIVSVYNVKEKKLCSLTLEDYLISVVAGEMPASFELEALKAQAVAARTFTAKRMRNLGGSGCGDHTGADVCTSSAHCQAYCSVEDMKTKWGSSFDENYAKIKNAVDETGGQILTYNGKPIDAIYHSNSGGMTEDVENVYAQALPYLRSVSSPGEESFNKYTGEVTVSISEFIEIIEQRRSGVRLSQSGLSGEVQILSHFESGRVDKIKVGNAEFTGKDFRSMFGLNSTNFTISIENEVKFTTKGFGHGVGMSQAGADAMAQSGSDYKEILHHYYTDVDFSVLS